MSPEQFDYARMNANLYNGLNSALDVSAFLSMASDYVRHLRTGPIPSSAERACADHFLEMIDNERAWPLVRHTIREFKDTNAVDDAHTPDLLKYVLRSIQPRMKEIHQFIRSTDLDKIEDLISTSVIKAKVDSIVYHLDGKEHASEEQRKVSSAILDGVMKVYRESLLVPEIDDQGQDQPTSDAGKAVKGKKVDKQAAGS